MFGKGYFGESYFNGRYFGPEIQSPPDVVIEPAYHRERQRRRKAETSEAAPVDREALSVPPSMGVPPEHLYLERTALSKAVLDGIEVNGEPVSFEDEEQAVAATILLMN